MVGLCQLNHQLALRMGIFRDIQNIWSLSQNRLWQLEDCGCSLAGAIGLISKMRLTLGWGCCLGILCGFG